ncbi:hypothetical protein ACFUJ0_34640 [Streptomyces sp. NPDC057242]
MDTAEIDEVAGQLMAAGGSVLFENGDGFLDASGIREQLGDM